MKLSFGQKISILAIALLYIFSPDYSLAYVLGDPMDTAGSISLGGQGLGIDFGNPDYPDSTEIECDNESSDCTLLISTSTPYTILARSSVAIYGDNDPSFECNSVPLPSQGLNYICSAQGIAPCMYTSYVQYHCSGDLTTNNLLSLYYVQYVPYDTRLVRPTVQDAGNLSFGMAIIIFFLSLMFVAMIFNKMSSKKKWQ